MELIALFEYVGTAAFALSAAIVAIEYKLDLFGILVLAVTTSVGGGMIRDILLNITPPVMFTRPVYCVIALITAFAIIVLYRALHRRDWYQALSQNINVLKSLIALFDAIGLGVFTIVGADAAISRGYGDNRFFVVFIATITGVGGGILRDILVNRKPVILSREVYALASIIGALAYVYLRERWSGTLCLYLCAALIALIRMAAVAKNINLPQLKKLDL